MTQKIFCIGFHKTGTTSLAEALQMLGYRVTGPNGNKDPDIAKDVYTMADQLVAEYDAFQDNPWPIIYKTLDEKYPGSKFILTLRDPDQWLNSQVQHFGTAETPMRRWIYGASCGCPQGNESIYLNRFNTHNQDVVDYFKSRPDDLLTMTVADTDAWEKLCRFLNKPVPSSPFPHTNKASDRQKSIDKQTNILGRGRRVISRVKRRLMRS